MTCFIIWESNAVRSARTFAHYVGCKNYQVKSVEEID